MNVLLIFLLAFGACVAAFLIYGYSIPAKWEVVESALVSEEREALFEYLCTIRNWEEWTIWNREENTDFEFKYEGPVAGAGATQCWRAKGKFGKTRIRECQPPDKIAYQFSFGHGHHAMEGVMELRPRGSQTEVTWKAHGDAGSNPSRRIMAKMFIPFIHKDFQRGLERLKRIMAQKVSGTEGV